ncbi:MAG: PHP domain-containing protein [Chloroflexi bacterium]|nr:PHP domain-containing protein [Chloroflexota bacterium]
MNSAHSSTIVDLHIHTTASDGVHTAQEVVDLALRAGLRVMAITDHDTLAALPAALDAASGRIQMIPGVEISCEGPRGEVHLLAYYIDRENVPLREALARSQHARIGRARAVLERLRGLGIDISWERVLQLAGDGAIGRPHIAAALTEAQHVGSVREAFDRYLAQDRPAFVARAKLSPEEAIRLARQAGGVPVLAHPWGQEEMVPALARAGLAGLEAYYTGYSDQVVSGLVALAKRHRLITTGGSDFHGQAVIPERRMGDARVPMHCVRALERERERIRAEA